MARSKVDSYNSDGDLRKYLCMCVRNFIAQYSVFLRRMNISIYNHNCGRGLPWIMYRGKCNDDGIRALCVLRTKTITVVILITSFDRTVFYGCCVLRRPFY